MRFESITLHESAEQAGDCLPLQKLAGLGKVVVLAGPNGSGKTRLLRRVQLARYWDPRRPFHTSFAIRRDATGVASVVEYKFRFTKLKGSDQYTLDQMRAAASAASSLGSEQLEERVLAYIQTAQNRNWEVTHPRYPGTADSKENAERDYNQLRETVRSLLGVDLGRTELGQATLFNRPLAMANLSEGQQHLLSWAVVLHAQQVKLGELILVLDEPENHLHPDAALKAVRALIDANPNGQTWVGTHSVPLVAGLADRYRNDVSLYFMDNGLATYADRSPELVVLSLMGGAGNVQAVREFLDLPEVLAANRFAAECLFPPPIVSGANPHDPQVTVLDACLTPLAGGRPKVLDFGAGDGRLVESLAARHGPLDDTLDYVAWDIPESDAKRCAAALKRAYQIDATRRFTDRDVLFNAHPVGSFDVAVMCNVLHEIDPRKWPEVFALNGVIARALKPSGKLIVVEDYLMPKGERAHHYGFIVLNTEALKALFRDDAGAGITTRQADGRYASRIRAHIIPRELFGNVSSESRKAALELAQLKARGAIAEYRSRSSFDSRSGREHAYWVQQFANTSLALEEL